MEAFFNAESFYDALRAKFKAGKAMDFHGTYNFLLFRLSLVDPGTGRLN
jgi:hypothetical protein